MQTGLLPRFFESVTRQAFGDLAIDDAPALRYLTELLTRFVRTEATVAKQRISQLERRLRRPPRASAAQRR